MKTSHQLAEEKQQEFFSEVGISKRPIVSAPAYTSEVEVK